MNCRIIEDLLPLYLEDACSEESRRAVEEHLWTCEKCRKKAKNWQMDYVTLSQKEKVQENLEEGELLVKREKAIKKETRMHIFGWVILADFVLLSGILFVIIRYLIHTDLNYILQQDNLLSISIPFVAVAVLFEGIFLVRQYILKKETTILSVWVGMMLGMQICMVVIGIVLVIGALATVPVNELGRFMI